MSAFSNAAEAILFGIAGDYSHENYTSLTDEDVAAARAKLVGLGFVEPKVRWVWTSAGRQYYRDHMDEVGSIHLTRSLES